MSGPNQSFAIPFVSTTALEDFDLGFRPKVLFAMGAGISSGVLSPTVAAQGYAGFGWSPGELAQSTSAGSGGNTGSFPGGSNISDGLFTTKALAADLSAPLLIAGLNCDTSPGHPHSGYSLAKGASYFAQLIPTIALGGDDIQVATGQFAWPGAAGNEVVTGVGFVPQTVMFLWTNTASYNEAGVRGSAYGFGAASSSSSANQFCHYERLAYFGLAGSMCKNGRVCLVVGDSGFIADGTLASMDPDGFTVSFSGADTGESGADSGRLIGWIALRNNGGGGFHVGTAAAKASTGTASYTGAGFEPDQVIVSHGNNPADNTFYLNARASWGAGMFDDTLQASIVNGDGILDCTYSGRRMNASAIAFIMTCGAASSEAVFSSMDPDGFTLNWTVSDGTPCPWGWIAMKTSGGNAPCGGGGFVPQIYRWLKK